ANTLAMNVRERSTEYALLRALGFRPPQLGLLIFGEAVCLACSGGALGLALSYPLVQLGLGLWLEENMGKYFPVLRISLSTQASALAASAALGVLAALLPALRTARMPLAAALRRVA